MEFSYAKDQVNGISMRLRGKKLSSGEEVALFAAWFGLNYEQAVAQSGQNCSRHYVGSLAGPGLWRVLSEEWGFKVRKKNVRPQIEARYKTSESKYIGTQFPRVIGVLPKINNFVGYKAEVQQCLADIQACKSVLICGGQGIGKTALSAHVVEQLLSSDSSPSLEYLIWQPLGQGYLLVDLLCGLAQNLQILGQGKITENEIISLLLDFFSKHRCVIVFDEAEVILRGDKAHSWDQYSEKYRSYCLFFSRFIKEQSNSSILLLSRNRFVDWFEMQGEGFPVSIIQLTGLGFEAEFLFEEKDLKDIDQWSVVINKYRGNPSVLKSVSDIIKNFFDGSVSKFLEFHSTIIMSSFVNALNDEFSQDGSLTSIELKIIQILFSKLPDKNLMKIDEILSFIRSKDRSIQLSLLIQSIDSLLSRSMLESVQIGDESYLQLNPFVRKYLLVDPLGYARVLLRE